MCICFLINVNVRIDKDLLAHTAPPIIFTAIGLKCLCLIGGEKQTHMQERDLHIHTCIDLISLSLSHPKHTHTLSLCLSVSLSHTFTHTHSHTHKPSSISPRRSSNAYERLALVAAFTVSSFACISLRVGKPFNPLLVCVCLCVGVCVCV